jgi:hypothetical protein
LKGLRVGRLLFAFGPNGFPGHDFQLLMRETIPIGP